MLSEVVKLKTHQGRDLHTSSRNLKSVRSILVIDDSADLLELIKAILEIEDYVVFTASNGKGALSILSEISRPSLILLDMQLGDMSGTEFLESLERHNPEMIEKVPVVFLTGMDRVPAGRAIGVLRKPVGMDGLLEAVHRFIELGAERAQHKH